jgi:phosphosulfolactate synthase (CoM biosynthesis protein A)
MADKLYCIEVTDAKKNRGYVIDGANGLKITNKLTADVKTFTDYMTAKKWAWAKQLNRKKCSFKVKHIVQSEGIVPIIETDLYCIGVFQGDTCVAYVHYDTALEDYITKVEKLGCAVFANSLNAEALIQDIEPIEGVSFIVVPLLQN